MLNIVFRDVQLFANEGNPDFSVWLDSGQNDLCPYVLQEVVDVLSYEKVTINALSAQKSTNLIDNPSTGDNLQPKSSPTCAQIMSQLIC